MSEPGFIDFFDFDSMCFDNIINYLNHGLNGFMDYTEACPCNLLILQIRDSDWQLNNKLRPLTLSRFHFYFPAMCFHNIVA